MELVVGTSGAGLASGKTPWHQDADSLRPDAEPHELPGLLTASLQLHRLFRSPIEDWSEVVYTGTERHSVTAQSLDVLRTQQGPVTCRWLFEETSPFPVAVDVEAGTGQDEARLLFEDWNTDGNLPVPSRIGVIIPQTEQVAWLNVQTAELRQ